LIQDCREACGGHGYLKCAKLGDLRNDNDPNCTYEGENNVLIQQASNFLLSLRAKGFESFEKASPLKSAEYLKDGDKIKNLKWTWTNEEDALNPESKFNLNCLILNNIFTNNLDLLQSLTWIVVYLLEKTFNLTKSIQSKSQLEIRNNSQVFHANSLASAYAHRQIFAASLNEISKLENSPEKEVLRKLLSLYGANLIVTKYLATLFEGNFISSDVSPGILLQNGILKLLSDLKNEAVALVDAIAPTDFILNSPLGMSDGNIYKHLENYLYQTEDTFTRPKWWREIINRDSVNAKL
jgi:acyl-CoA oxidase